MECYVCSCPPKFACECSNPKVLICEKHLPNHISNDNIHKFTALQSPESNKKFTLALISLFSIKSQTILNFGNQIEVIRKKAEITVKQMDNIILAFKKKFIEMGITQGFIAEIVENLIKIENIDKEAINSLKKLQKTTSQQKNKAVKQLRKKYLKMGCMKARL